MNQQTFSIIIATYSRPKALANCLAEIARLSWPRDRFEVVVVDDGGSVPLDDVVATHRGAIDITLHHQINAGPASARNAGAGRAKFDYIAFTDDDCQPARDWLEQLAREFDRTPDALVGGNVINLLHNDPYATASQYLVSYLYEYYNRDSGGPSFFTSNNFAVSRRAFAEMNGFDTSYRRAAAEDREFCDRWRARGGKMVYAPAAVIYHAHHMSMRQFWRQHFNYGRGAYRFHQVRAMRNARPIRIEPFGFYWNLLAYPFHTRVPRPLGISLLLGVSQAANALGFFQEKFIGGNGAGPVKPQHSVDGPSGGTELKGTEA